MLVGAYWPSTPAIDGEDSGTERVNPEGDSDGGTELVDRTGVGLQEGPPQREGRDWPNGGLGRLGLRPGRSLVLARAFGGSVG